MQADFPFPIPQCPDVEMNLLGSCIREPKLIPFAAELVDSEDFSYPEFQMAWKYLQGCFNSKKTPIATVLNEQIGDQGYFQSLVDSSTAFDADGIRDMAQVVNDFAVRRQGLYTIHELAHDLSNQHVEMCASDIIAQKSQELANVRGMTETSVDACDVIDEIVDDLENHDALACYSTGIHQLDQIMAGGVYSKKFYGIAARQKHGKTTILSTISYNLGLQQVPHLYLTLEGASTEIIQTQVAREMGFNRLRFLEPRYRSSPEFAEDVRECRKRFANRGMRIDKKPGMTFNMLKSTISRAAIKGEVRGVIVDYIQLVNQDRGQRDTQAQHFDMVAQWLAEAAKMYGIFIIGAAQLNRDGEVRGGDGLLNACDMALYQHKHDTPYGMGDKSYDALWLEMRASRYTPYANIGSEEVPGLVIRKDRGPFIEAI